MSPERVISDCVPPILDRQRLEELRESFLHEHRPVGPTEIAIVWDMARQAAAMERWGEAAGAVERQAARGLHDLFLVQATDGQIPPDAVLAGAMSAEAADRCERHNLGHARAFYRGLQKLHELQARRKTRQLSDEMQPPPAFPNEAACETYLMERFRCRKYQCLRCGVTEGYLFVSRKCWECRGCKTQAGLRSGTVMARSPLPLMPWFEGIRWILWSPTISTAELALKTGIRRPTTVRTIARKIREALGEDDADNLLAGLAAHFSQGKSRS